MKTSFLTKWLTLFFFVFSQIPPEAFAVAPSYSNISNPGIIPGMKHKLVIAPEIGSIQKSWFAGDSGSGQWVIHVQDLHSDYDAQKNISEILKAIRYFVKTNAPADYEKGILIAMEGAEGKIDASFFSVFPDAQARHDTADYYLRKARFTGPEFFQITHGDWPMDIFGIEDKELYLEHKEVYLRCMDQQKIWSLWLKNLRKKLLSLEKEILGTSSKTLIEKKRAFETEKIGILEYREFLSRFAAENQIGTSDLRQFALLTRMSELQTSADVRGIERERNALFEDLSKRLPKEELQGWVKKNLEYRLGRVDESDYYRDLRALLPNGEWQKYPHLSKYVELVELKAGFDSQLFFAELSALESRLIDKLFASQEEKSYLALAKIERLLSKLVALGLTREDLHDLEVSKPEFGSVLASYHFNLPGEFSDFEKFYEIAQKRDAVIYAQTLNAMKESGRKIAVLVTGGFHTEGIMRQFEQNGITYTVITPQTKGVRQITEELYQARMMGKQSLLENALAGKAQTLHPGSFLKPLTRDPELAEEMMSVFRYAFALVSGSFAEISGKSAGQVLEEWRHANKRAFPELEDMDFVERDLVQGDQRSVLVRAKDEFFVLTFSPADRTLPSEGGTVLDAGTIGRWNLTVTPLDLDELEAFGKEAKDLVERHTADNKIFSSNFPEEKVYEFFRNRSFIFLAKGTQAKAFVNREHVVKIAFQGLSLGESEREFIGKLKILKTLWNLYNRYERNWSVLIFVKSQIKALLNHFRPLKKDAPDQIFRAAKIAAEHYQDRTVPFRVVDPRRLNIQGIKEEELAVSGGKAILQQKVKSFVIDALKEMVQRGDLEGAKNLVRQGIEFQAGLWGRGALDADTGVQIFENYTVNEKGEIKIVDFGGMQDSFKRAEEFVVPRGEFAAKLLNMMQGKLVIASEIGRTFIEELEKPHVIGFIATLRILEMNFDAETASDLGKVYFEAIAKLFTRENLERTWGAELEGGKKEIGRGKGLFDSDVTEEEIARLFEGRKFTKIGHGFESNVYSPGGSVVVKIPNQSFFVQRVSRVADRAMYWAKIFGGSFGVSELAGFFVPAAQFLRHRWTMEKEMAGQGPDRVVATYEISLKRLEGLVVPFRFISPEKLDIRISETDRKSADLTKKAILQEKVDEKDFLWTRLMQAYEKDDVEGARDIVRAAADFQISLWRRGLIDWDFSNFDNLVLNDDGFVRLLDVGGVLEGKDTALDFFGRHAAFATVLHEKLKAGQEPSRIVLETISSGRIWHEQEVWDLSRNLVRMNRIFRDKPEFGRQVMGEWFKAVSELTQDKVEENWEKDLAQNAAETAGARKNIADTDGRLSETHAESLETLARTKAREISSTTSKDGSAFTYKLIEFEENDAIGKILAKFGGAYHQTDSSDGTVYVFVQENVKDRKIAIEHEELEIKWEKQLADEESSLAEGKEPLWKELGFEDRQRAAHILAWAEQIHRNKWTSAESSVFIQSQIGKMSIQELTKIITEDRKKHAYLIQAYLQPQLKNNIVKRIDNFEKSVRKMAAEKVLKDLSLRQYTYESLWKADHKILEELALFIPMNLQGALKEIEGIHKEKKPRTRLENLIVRTSRDVKDIEAMPKDEPGLGVFLTDEESELNLIAANVSEDGLVYKMLLNFLLNPRASLLLKDQPDIEFAILGKGSLRMSYLNALDGTYRLGDIAKSLHRQIVSDLAGEYAQYVKQVNARVVIIAPRPIVEEIQRRFESELKFRVEAEIEATLSDWKERLSTLESQKAVDKKRVTSVQEQVRHYEKVLAEIKSSRFPDVKTSTGYRRVKPVYNLLGNLLRKADRASGTNKLKLVREYLDAANQEYWGLAKPLGYEGKKPFLWIAAQIESLNKELGQILARHGEKYVDTRVAEIKYDLWELNLAMEERKTLKFLRHLPVRVRRDANIYNYLNKLRRQERITKKTEKEAMSAIKAGLIKLGANAALSEKAKEWVEWLRSGKSVSSIRDLIQNYDEKDRVIAEKMIRRMIDLANRTVAPSLIEYYTKDLEGSYVAHLVQRTQDIEEFKAQRISQKNVEVNIDALRTGGIPMLIYEGGTRRERGTIPDPNHLVGRARQRLSYFAYTARAVSGITGEAMESARERVILYFLNEHPWAKSEREAVELYFKNFESQNGDLQKTFRINRSKIDPRLLMSLNRFAAEYLQEAGKKYFESKLYALYKVFKLPRHAAFVRDDYFAYMTDRSLFETQKSDRIEPGRIKVWLDKERTISSNVEAVSTMKGDEHWTAYRDTRPGKDSTVFMIHVDMDYYQALDLLQRKLDILDAYDGTFFEAHEAIREAIARGVNEDKTAEEIAKSIPGFIHEVDVDLNPHHLKKDELAIHNQKILKYIEEYITPENLIEAGAAVSMDEAVRLAGEVRERALSTGKIKLKYMLVDEQVKLSSGKRLFTGRKTRVGATIAYGYVISRHEVESVYNNSGKAVEAAKFAERLTGNRRIGHRGAVVGLGSEDHMRFEKMAESSRKERQKMIESIKTALPKALGLSPDADFPYGDVAEILYLAHDAPRPTLPMAVANAAIAEISPDIAERLTVNKVVELMRGLDLSGPVSSGHHARKNIADESGRITETEMGEVEKVVSSLNLPETTQTLGNETLSYTLVEYDEKRQEDVLGQIFKRFGGSYQASILGKNYIFVSKNIADREVAVEHEILKIAWVRRLQGKEKELLELGFDISRAAHVLAWGEQIVRRDWKRAENAPFILQQLFFLNLAGDVQKVINETRTLHHQLLGKFMPMLPDFSSSTPEGRNNLKKIAEFGTSFKAYAKMMLNSIVPGTIIKGEKSSYQILRQLGRGGMAQVWEALEVNENRIVAIKFYDEERLPQEIVDVSSGETPSERRTASRPPQSLVEESFLQAMAGKGIPEVYDYGGGLFGSFLVMEKAGEPLSKTKLSKNLQRAFLGSPTRILQAKAICEKLLEIIEKAHDKKILHRDIKPANILYDDDELRLVLIDFGIAVKNALMIWQPKIVGTKGYIAPDTIYDPNKGSDKGERRGKKEQKYSYSPRTELFQIGCTLYEILTGRKAFPDKKGSDRIGEIAKEIEKLPAWKRRWLNMVGMDWLFFLTLTSDPFEDLYETPVNSQLIPLLDVVEGMMYNGIARKGERFDMKTDHPAGQSDLSLRDEKGNFQRRIKSIEEALEELKKVTVRLSAGQFEEIVAALEGGVYSGLAEKLKHEEGLTLTDFRETQSGYNYKGITDSGEEVYFSLPKIEIKSQWAVDVSGETSLELLEPTSILRAVGGARKSLTDANARLTETEFGILTAFASQTAQNTVTRDINGHSVTYQLVEYHESDAAGQLLRSRNVGGAYQFIAEDGQAYIFILKEGADYELALQHEELELYWIQKLKEEEKALKPGEDPKWKKLGFASLQNAAHALSWAHQITARGWTKAEDAPYIFDQLNSMSVNQRLNLLAEDRSRHRELFKTYLSSERDPVALNNIDSFESSVIAMASIFSAKQLEEMAKKIEKTRPYIAMRWKNLAKEVDHIEIRELLYQDKHKKVYRAVDQDGVELDFEYPKMQLEIRMPLDFMSSAAGSEGQLKIPGRIPTSPLEIPRVTILSIIENYLTDRTEEQYRNIKIDPVGKMPPGYEASYAYAELNKEKDKITRIIVRQDLWDRIKHDDDALLRLRRHEFIENIVLGKAVYNGFLKKEEVKSRSHAITAEIEAVLEGTPVHPMAIRLISLMTDEELSAIKPRHRNDPEGIFYEAVQSERRYRRLRQEAAKLASQYKFAEGERQATLFLSHFLTRGGLSGPMRNAIQEILNEATTNEGDYQRKTKIIRLAHPIEAFPGDKDPITHLEIQGVSFDENRAEDLNASWQNEVQDFDENGRSLPHRTEHTPKYVLFADRVLQDFLYTHMFMTQREFYNQIGNLFSVKIPVGWGEFPQKHIRGKRLGFAVYGIRRTQLKTRGIERFTEEAVAKYGRALRNLHDMGYVYRPTEKGPSYSSSAKGTVVLHDFADLIPRRSLTGIQDLAFLSADIKASIEMVQESMKEFFGRFLPSQRNKEREENILNAFLEGYFKYEMDVTTADLEEFLSLSDRVSEWSGARRDNPVLIHLDILVAGKFVETRPAKAFKAPGTGVQKAQGPPNPEKIKLIIERLVPAEFEGMSPDVLESLGDEHKNDFAHYKGGKTLVRLDLWGKVEKDPKAKNILFRHEWVENVLIPRLIEEGVLEAEDINDAHAIASAVDAALEGTSYHALMPYVIDLMTVDQLQAIQPEHYNDTQKEFYSAVQKEIRKKLNKKALEFLDMVQYPEARRRTLLKEKNIGLFVEVLSRLTKEFDLDVSDKKVVKRLLDVSFQIVNKGESAWQSSQETIKYLRDELRMDLKIHPFSWKSKVLTIIYGIGRGKKAVYEAFIKTLEDIEANFSISVRSMDDEEKQRIATAAFYVAQGKAKGLQHFKDAVEVMQNIFVIPQEKLKGLELAEKIRLITAAYNVAFGKEKGLEAFKETFSAIQATFALSDKDLKGLELGEKIRLITAAYHVALGKDGLKTFKGTLSTIQNVFGLSNDDLKGLELAEKIRLMTAAYNVAMEKEKGLAVFKETLSTIQRVFDLSDDALKGLELAEKIKLISAAYHVALGKEKGLAVFKETLSTIQRTFALSDEALKGLDLSEKIRLITSAYHVALEKENGLTVFKETLSTIQRTFALSDDDLKGLELSEKLRLIAAAYHVSLTKESGIAVFRETLGVIQKTFALSDGDLKGLELSEKIRLITATYPVTMEKRKVLTVFKEILSTIQSTFELSDDDLKSFKFSEKIRLITAAYHVALEKESGLAVFKQTLSTIQGAFGLSDDALKGLELAEKIGFITAVYAVTLKKKGLTLFEEILNKVQGTFALSREDLKGLKLSEKIRFITVAYRVVMGNGQRFRAFNERVIEEYLQKKLNEKGPEKFWKDYAGKGSIFKIQMELYKEYGEKISLAYLKEVFYSWDLVKVLLRVSPAMEKELEIQRAVQEWNPGLRVANGKRSIVLSPYVKSLDQAKGVEGSRIVDTFRPEETELALSDQLMEGMNNILKEKVDGEEEILEGLERFEQMLAAYLGEDAEKQDEFGGREYIEFLVQSVGDSLEGSEEELRKKIGQAELNASDRKYADQIVQKVKAGKSLNVEEFIVLMMIQSETKDQSLYKEVEKALNHFKKQVEAKSIYDALILERLGQVIEDTLGEDGGAFKTPGTGVQKAQGPPDEAKIKAIRSRLENSAFENIPFEVVDYLADHPDDFAHYQDGKIFVRRDLWEKIANDSVAQLILQRHEWVENVLIRDLIAEGVLKKGDENIAHALTSAVDALEEGTPYHGLMKHVMGFMTNEQLKAIGPDHPNDANQIFYKAVQDELQRRLREEKRPEPLIMANEVYNPERLRQLADEIEKSFPDVAKSLRGLAREVQYVKILGHKGRDPKNRKLNIFKAVNENGLEIDFRWPARLTSSSVPEIAPKTPRWLSALTIAFGSAWVRLLSFCVLFLPLAACRTIPPPTAQALFASQEESYRREVVAAFEDVYKKMPDKLNNVSNEGKKDMARFLEAIRNGSRKIKVLNTPYAPTSEMGSSVIKMGPSEIELNYEKIKDYAEKNPVWLEISSIHESEHLNQTSELKELDQLFNTLFPPDLLELREKDRDAYFEFLFDLMKTDPVFREKMTRYASLRIEVEAKARLTQFKHIAYILKHYPSQMQERVKYSRAAADLEYITDEDGNISLKRLWMTTLNVNGFKSNFPDPFFLILQYQMEQKKTPRMDLAGFENLNAVERKTYFWDYPVPGMKPGDFERLILDGRWLPELVTPTLKQGAFKIPGFAGPKLREEVPPWKVSMIHSYLNPADFKDIKVEPVDDLGEDHKNDFAHYQDGKILIRRDLWDSIQKDPDPERVLDILRRHEWVENVLISRLIDEGVLEAEDVNDAHAISSAVDAAEEGNSFHDLMKHTVPIMTEEQLDAIGPHHPNDPNQAFYLGTRVEWEKRLQKQIEKISQPVPVEESERKATLNIHKEILKNNREQEALRLALEKIKEVIGKNWDGETNRRSTVIELDYPLQRFPHDDHPITHLQIKGVVFDAKQFLSEHRDAGRARSLYFGEDGTMYVRNDGGKPEGGAWLKESLLEFMSTEQLWRASAYFEEGSTLLGKVHVKHPLGWGEFPGLELNGRRLGFIVLGMNDDTVGPRGIHPLSLSNFENYGKTIRSLHEAQLVHSFAHPGNIRVDEDHLPVFHDLADLRDFKDLSDNQKLGYVYTELVYILSQLQRYGKGHEYSMAFLQGYFGDQNFQPGQRQLRTFLGYINDLARLKIHEIQNSNPIWLKLKAVVKKLGTTPSPFSFKKTTKKAMGEEDLNFNEVAILQSIIQTAVDEKGSQKLNAEDFDRLGIADILNKRNVASPYQDEHSKIVEAVLSGESVTLTKPIQGRNLYEKAKVEVHVIDLEKERGFRLPGRKRPIYEWTEVDEADGQAVIRVFVTKAFMEANQGKPSVIAQAIIHPLVENMLVPPTPEQKPKKGEIIRLLKTAGATHLEAVQHESFYQADDFERQRAGIGFGVLSDFSTWVLEEAAREGDWEYLGKMTGYWRINLEKYPELDVKVRGRANSIYPLVMDKAWEFILKDEKILLNILKGSKDRERMIDFLRDLISRAASSSAQAKGGTPFPDAWLEAFLSNPNFTPLDFNLIASRALRGEGKQAFLKEYQGRLVHALKNQGIEIKAEGEALQIDSYIPALDALRGFPDWLAKVQPDITSGDQRTGFRVKKWMTTLKINSKSLGQRFLERLKHIIIFNVFHYFGYDGMNRLSDYRGVTRDFNTPLDQMIPLIPQAVFVYLLLFPIIILPAFLVKKVREFRAGIGAFFTSLITLFTVFMVFPARMTRPESIVGNSWAHDILRWYYEADLPYNTTPSNHVTLSALAGLILFRSATHPFRHIHLIVGAMIGLSTVFVKQHFVVDILSGWLVAYLSFKIWFDWTKYWMDPLRNFFKGRWKNSTSSFMKKVYVWMIGQLNWFKVSDVDRYPSWRIDIVKDLRNAKSVSRLEIAFDSSIKKKDRFVIRDGVIYMHPDIVQESRGRENFYENLYNKVLEHMALASKPYALAERQRDETFEERLGNLSARDLYELDESILSVMGGEEKAKEWFDSWNLKYSFADFKEALNALRVYFVMTPGNMGSRPLHMVEERIEDEEGKAIFQRGDVLLDYRMFDHLMTQAALTKDNAVGKERRDDFYKASLALLVEALHDHMQARMESESEEISPLPDAIKKAQGAVSLEFIRDEALRDMMLDFKTISFDEMAWDIERNEFRLKNHGKTVKKYALGELMKDPETYQKIQAEWQSRGVGQIRWARSLGAYRVLHQLNVFLAGVPDHLPENPLPIGFRDARGYIHYLQMSKPGILYVNRFNALDDLPSAGPAEAPPRIAESVDAAA